MHDHHWVGHHRDGTTVYTLFCDACPAEITTNDPDTHRDLFDHLNRMVAA